MRDSNRLDNSYEEIKELHRMLSPDLRIGQFLLNFIESQSKDLYYMEDREFIQKLRDYVKEVRKI